jgi:two-component system, NtrC family, sensor kinase
LQALLLDKLPSILVLGVLLGIFIALRKHAPSPRMHLWIVAWALIFVHFLVQVFEVHTGVVEGIYESIDLLALELAGIVFVISVTATANNRFLRRVLEATLIVPVVFHAVGATFGWHANWALAGALAVVFFVGLTFPLFAYRRTSVFHACICVVLIAMGIWSVSAQLRGNPDPGETSLLTLGYGLAGIIYWKRCLRLSAGTVTVIGGFLSWGAVFPVSMLLDHFYPHFQVNSEIWNVPKFFVAFGMILSLLEDKSRIIEESSGRERAENAMLQRFSRVTSGLLGTRDPAALCGEVAEAITQTSTFHRAAVLLATKDGALSLAGCCGISSRDAGALRKRAAEWTAENLRKLCESGDPLGPNSVRVCVAGLLALGARSAPADASGLAPMGIAVAPWSAVRELDVPMAEVIVPLMPSRGSAVGWIVLCAPEEALRARPSEIINVEMLAADLAVTIENTRLHRQLVRSEKLAALGQLVAGVAHELNNPLTGVIGYTELLTDEVQEPGAQLRLGKLGREAQRMKRIVEGLLRFARQNNPEDRASNFEAALRDAVTLREHHLRARGVHVHIEVAPHLPSLAIGEDELKQVLLNLLNNSVDAIEDSKEKNIRIHALCHAERVEIRIDDSGPGFADLNRAFDPFYTTKAVGKGTGLGLSICYGIVQECGGEIHLANMHPYGASVTIELPVAQATPAPALTT